MISKILVILKRTVGISKILNSKVVISKILVIMKRTVAISKIVKRTVAISEILVKTNLSGAPNCRQKLLLERWPKPNEKQVSLMYQLNEKKESMTCNGWP